MSDSDPKKQAKSSAPKVFDVMRPGKAQPSASSRPLIAGHKPQVRDASTVTDKPQTINDERALMAHKSNGVEPTTAPALPAAEEAPVSSAATETDAVSAANTEQEVSALSEPMEHVAPETPEVEAPPVDEEDETTDNIMMSPVEPLDAPEKKSEIELQPVPPASAEVAPTAPAPQQPPSNPVVPPSSAPRTKVNVAANDSVPAPVVDKSKIVVSHHGRERKPHHWGKKFLILFIILVLAATAAYVLYDAGIIKTNLKLPHTHLFDKKTPSSNDDDKQKSNDNQSDSNTNQQPAAQQDSTAYAGYTVYKNSSLGFAFAYPKDWDALTESTPASDSVVLAAESADTGALKDATMTGKLTLLVSKKDSYQVVAAKNGATVQPTNQGGNYSWKVAAVDPADTKDKVGDMYAATIARKAGSLTVFDFTMHDASCTQARWVFETSGGYAEIDAPGLCPKTPGAAISAQAQADYKILTTNILNSITTSL